jgi:hypothetical protein
MEWKLARCKITIRPRPLDLWRFQPSSRIDEVYKLMKYEAPFGTACGHRRWSQERKELVQTSSISKFRGSGHGE